MGEYEDNLHHVAEPASPSERRGACSTTIEDWEGLWFTDVLRGYAHYGETATDERVDIALAYAEFIDNKVRKAKNDRVTLYVHTDTARATLSEAIAYAPNDGCESALILNLQQAIERLDES